MPIGPSPEIGLFAGDPGGKIGLGAVAQRVAEMRVEKRGLGFGAFEGLGRVVIMRVVDTGRGCIKLGMAHRDDVARPDLILAVIHLGIGEIGPDRAAHGRVVVGIEMQ